MDDGEEEVPPEFECSICMKLLLDPVTVSCGHTFCRVCLEKSLGYRGLCAVCRAPTAAGQGVNVLVRGIIGERYPRALARRQSEEEEELRAGERAADEARRREAHNAAPEMPGADAVLGGRGGHGGQAPVLPLLHGFRPGICFLPHCPVEVDMRTDAEERLIEFALQGGRRVGVLLDSAEVFDVRLPPLGVCFEVENVERPLQRRPRVRLAGKFRFWLVEPPQMHEGGFSLGRCEAFFDQALNTADLTVRSPQDQLPEVPSGEVPAALRQTASELAADVLMLLEAQLIHVGHSGRRVFAEHFGDVLAAPAAGHPATSASLEKLSFWLLGVITTKPGERRRMLLSQETRGRLEHCRTRLEAAGQRPILNLPGASSWMSPGQSALKSLALLVAIMALLVAKALGWLEPGNMRFTGGGQHWGDPNNMQDAFAFGQLLR